MKAPVLLLQQPRPLLIGSCVCVHGSSMMEADGDAATFPAARPLPPLHHPSSSAGFVEVAVEEVQKLQEKPIKECSSHAHVNPYMTSTCSVYECVCMRASERE